MCSLCADSSLHFPCRRIFQSAFDLEAPCGRYGYDPPRESLMLSSHQKHEAASWGQDVSDRDDIKH